MNNPSPVPFRDQQTADMAEYAKNLKGVAKITVETNEKEIAAIHQQLDVLQADDFEYMRLPILSHTYIILNTKDRFGLLPMFINLLVSLKERMRTHSMYSDVEELRSVITFAEEIRKEDTLDDYPGQPLYNTSQFLSQYYITSCNYGLQPNHKEAKILNKIRQYMIKGYTAALTNKQKAIENCQNILSKKLYGE